MIGGSLVGCAVSTYICIVLLFVLVAMGGSMSQTETILAASGFYVDMGSSDFKFETESHVTSQKFLKGFSRQANNKPIRVRD